MKCLTLENGESVLFSRTLKIVSDETMIPKNLITLTYDLALQEYVSTDVDTFVISSWVPEVPPPLLHSKPMR